MVVVGNSNHIFLEYNSENLSAKELVSSDIGTDLYCTDEALWHRFYTQKLCTLY